MRDFLHRGGKVTLSTVAGTVLAAGQSSATTYTMQGGGGLVPAQGGYIAPPQLHGATVESSNLWLRLEDGIDRHFVLEDARVPILAGQRVAVVIGNTEGAVADVPVGLLNISSRMWFGLSGSEGLLGFIDQPSKSASVILMWMAIVLAFLVAALVAWLTEPLTSFHESALWTLAGAPCFGFAYWVYVRVTTVARVKSATQFLLLQAKADCQQQLALPKR